MDTIYDICVIGGGIHGTAIARDAAGRGFSVLLATAGDLGDGASSRTGKILQGGLRDLARRRFGAVRAALEECDTLLRMAPHVVRPLRVVLPDDREAGRPWWLLRLGFEFHDGLRGKKSRLPASSVVKLGRAPEGRPLAAGAKRGIAYTVCRADDSRLVVLNARSAADLGALVLTRTAVVGARRAEGLWRITLRDPEGRDRDVIARALVNAAGPERDQVLHRPAPVIRRIRRCHVVVPALYEGSQAYALQQGRDFVFVLPFEDRFSLVGSTEARESDGAEDAPPSAEELAALSAAVRRAFGRDIGGDIRHAFVELSTDGAADAPEARLEVEGERVEAPLLTVAGGFATYRRTVEAALDRLKPWFPNLRPPWTARVPLPGGDFPDADFARFLRGFRQRRSWLPPELSLRYARSYGTRADALLEGARALADLGQSFGAGLTEREVQWLAAEEWARTPEDVLWRRTKLGLHMTEEQRADFALWMAAAELQTV